jgi:hypothetical protein|nr:MAG TPA: hypothetical protein [Caudoviricetes sp.]
MNNKPICGEWHGNDVMPVELKDCLFEINLNKIKLTREYLIGFREGNGIRDMYDTEICGEISVIRWCYIDLN